MSRIVYTASSPSRKRAAWSKKKTICVALAIFILILSSATIYVFRLPQWQITTIAVSGTESLKEEEVRGMLEAALDGMYYLLLPKRSILLADVKALQDFLKNKILKIETADIMKEFPHTLHVAIRERRLWGIFCNDILPETADNAQCAYVDTGGFIYEEAPRATGPLIVKIRSDGERPEIGKTAIPREKAERIQEIVRLFSERLAIETAGFELLSKIPREVRLVSREGFKIYFDYTESPEELTKILHTILVEKIKEKRSTLDYIDARFGNKVFYKLK